MSIDCVNWLCQLIVLIDYDCQLTQSIDYDSTIDYVNSFIDSDWQCHFIIDSDSTIVSIHSLCHVNLFIPIDWFRLAVPLLIHSDCQLIPCVMSIYSFIHSDCLIDSDSTIVSIDSDWFLPIGSSAIIDSFRLCQLIPIHSDWLSIDCQLCQLIDSDWFLPIGCAIIDSFRLCQLIVSIDCVNWLCHYWYRLVVSFCQLIPIDCHVFDSDWFFRLIFGLGLGLGYFPPQFRVIHTNEKWPFKPPRCPS